MSQDRIEQANERLLALLRRLDSAWTEIDTAQADRLGNVAMYLLCAAGLIELWLNGRAWTDQTALDFEATACGVWIDFERNSILPDEVRRAVPAWAGKAVAVHLQSSLQARLTAFGEENKRHVEADEEGAFLFAAFVCMHPIGGRVTVRTVGNETAAPGTVQQDAIVGDGLLQALQAMVAAQKDIAEAVRDSRVRDPQAANTEAPADRGGGLAAANAGPTHSDDFTSVDWFGVRYTFTKGIQAESVRALWNAWEKAGHGLAQETIGERAGSSAARFELAKVFRVKNETGGYEPHPAWGTMIQATAKGVYSLVPSESMP